MKILYVEDVEIYAKALTRIAQHWGHEIVIATNGREGYEMAHKQPDLIFMDINLPDTNGLILAQKLRSENIKVPIIALTADLMNYDTKQALQAGCDDFM